MARLDSGVSRYIVARAIVENGFPVDFRGNASICCEACRFYRMSARRCALTDEIIPYPEKFVGGRCPLEPEEH